MGWSEQIDAYCERMGPEFWAEPWNAVTNLAFLVAALVMWPRVRRIEAGPALCVIVFMIGLGSFLFHTFATRWASVADVAAIAVFVLLYFYLANRHYWGLTIFWAGGVTVLFFPYAALSGWLFQSIGGGSSSLYMAVWLLIFIYGLALTRRAPAVAKGLIIGSVILLFSIVARLGDMPLCELRPHGTHYLWHCLNAVMLGWMIEVYRRHILSK